VKPYPEVPAGLIVEHVGPVLRICLDRPDRRNAITDPMVYALLDTVDAAASDESVRVIHLEGSGDHFSSGFDLSQRTPGPDRPRVGSVHRRMSIA
jgi:2-(1,2-epoxy-1,2-dihydrophenyl)acetyl-CoA isomerase